MQPAQSIPLYTENGVKSLVGLRCSVPTKSPDFRLWGKIVGTQFINSGAVFVRFVYDGANYRLEGNWYDLDVIRFDGHSDDPMLVAMCKATA